MDASSNKTQTGFTLIEVLVSVLILVFGLLGIAGMLGFTLKSNSSSYLKQLSIQSAYTMIDRMRANSAQAINGSYNFNNLATGSTQSTPAIICSAASCTLAQLALYDCWDWQVNDVARQFPAGRASITTAVSGNSTLVTITVQWDDRPAQSVLGAATPSSAPAAPNLAQFVTTALL